MAEKGAHLTQTVQLKPSIFDFVAQESLNDLLHPATKRIVDVLSFKFRLFQPAYKWFDEFFLFVQFLLQFHYLKRYGGTFSESFYGLKRIPFSSKRSTLQTRELVLSLLTVALFPYLKNKLQSKAEEMYLDQLPTETNRTKVKLMKSFIAFNSGVQISLQVINFLQHLRYMSEKSDVNSPLLWLAGVKLKYADEEDFGQDKFHFRNLIPQMLRRSLEVGAFFLQFYQWWQTQHVGSLGALPVPSPPEISEEGFRFAEVCPLCRRKRRIETALYVSGFVFCFKCITEHIQKNETCPVTNLPATLNQLIRLYPPS